MELSQGGDHRFESGMRYLQISLFSLNLLLVLAVGLVIAELLTASFGLLTAGGIIRLSARLSCSREEPCS